MNNYIQLFGRDHFLYIGILVLCIYLLFSQQEFIFRHRESIRWIILTVSIIQQFLLYGTYLITNNFTLEESLPLHISRINTILGIIFLYSKSNGLFSLISYFSVFAWLSFIAPSKVQAITHPLGISFLTNHIITTLLPFFAMIAYSFRLDKQKRKFAYILFTIYFIFVACFNPIVNGNYFYLKDKPILKSSPNIIYYPLALLTSYLLFYIIELIIDWIGRHWIRPHQQNYL